MIYIFSDRKISKLCTEREEVTAGMIVLVINKISLSRFLNKFYFDFIVITCSICVINNCLLCSVCMFMQIM